MGQVKSTNTFAILTLLAITIFGCSQPENKTNNTDILKTEEHQNDSVEIDEYWLENKIDHANIYLYFPELNESTGDIETNGELSPFIYDAMTKALDSARISDLQNRLIYPIQNLLVSADCYFPHHGIVYFDENNEIIGSTSICTACSQIKGDGTEIPVGYYKSLIDSLGLPNDHEPMDTIDELFQYREAVWKKLDQSGFEFRSLD